MNTTISHAKAWLVGLACGLVLVPWSDALAADTPREGLVQADEREGADRKVDGVERQLGKEQEAKQQEGPGRKDARGAIVKEFRAMEVTERQLQMRLMALRQKFQPGHPASRSLEARLDELRRRKTRLLEKHPFLLRQPKNPAQPQEDRIALAAKLSALEAKERVLQLHLDEVKKERELLLKKHPELRR